MALEELLQLDLSAQAEELARGRVSAAELIEAAIARAEKLDPILNAIIHPMFDRAREQAVAPELRSTRLQGVPIVLKDIGAAEAGAPNHAGMRALKQADYRELRDSSLTERLRAVGAISLGRTNTPELALLPTTEPEAYGPTRNPWRTEYSAGGSSGGSAAAVAAGIVAAAHASDGGGSIRGPSSMCGLIGLKPTRARVSMGPQYGERWSSLSGEFFVTRSVRDSALLLDLVSGPAPGDPYAAAPPDKAFSECVHSDPRPLRIGILRDTLREIPVHADPLHAVDRTARVLADLGHHVEEAHPRALADAAHVRAYVTIVACNTARSLDAYSERLSRTLTADDVEPLTWALAERARSIRAPEWLATIEYMHQFGRDVREFWQGGFDLLLTPTFAALPPRIGELAGAPSEPLRPFVRAAPYGVFTLPFNLTGQPAISLPVHRSPEGLPVGVQLVAEYGREDILLAISAQLERAELVSASPLLEP